MTNNSKNDFDFLFKVVLLGESNVEKSALILRSCENFFTESFVSTIGVDFKFKNIDSNEKRCKLQVKKKRNLNKIKNLIYFFL